jgi:hypothetical protein
MKAKLMSKIKVTALMGFIVISSAYAQDASTTSHEEHHPDTKTVPEKKGAMPMENGMMGKMDMKNMMGMMNECKEMHKDDSMCNQNMMEKCQMQMDKKCPATPVVTQETNAGLPIIRTSVDHGTAFEIAGKGIASEDAMVLAIESAVQLSKYRKSLQ